MQDRIPQQLNLSQPTQDALALLQAIQEYGGVGPTNKPQGKSPLDAKVGDLAKFPDGAILPITNFGVWYGMDGSGITNPPVPCVWHSASHPNGFRLKDIELV